MQKVEGSSPFSRFSLFQAIVGASAKLGGTVHRLAAG